MPRHARIVLPGVPHHVTQRGTDRQNTFFSNAARRVYLDLLALHSAEVGLRIVAYCLMLNHIHLVVVPERESSLAVAMRRVHGRYAQYWNARRQRSGHLWQNRYFSCPLGDGHLWAAIRYVEQNPVHARISTLPQEYRWSSAPYHLNGSGRPGSLDQAFYQDNGGRAAWCELHANIADSTEYSALREATYHGAQRTEETAQNENLHVDAGE